MSIKTDYFAKPFGKFYLLNTDSSPIFRPHSPTLPQRKYVHKPNNQIKGNKPVEVGYEFSCIGLSARRPLYGISEAPWNLPLSMRLIPYEENKNGFTARQVKDLLNNKGLPLNNSLVVNALDSKYASPEYIAETYDQQDLINIIRMASNRNVWKMLDEAEQDKRREKNASNRGAKAIYGEQNKLNKVEEWSLSPAKQTDFGIKLTNGRNCIVRIFVWEDMLIRSKRGKNMKDKPFSLIRIQLLDAESEQPIFKKSMWLGVWGKRAKELNEEEIYWSYRNRYDIEHFFRFGKQKLLLDKFQTPDEEHLQNWLEVVSLSYWSLWVGQSEASHGCPKWQKYDKNTKNRFEHKLKVSPSQVQMQMTRIILGFDQTPFLPKLQINGKGRQLGQTMPERQKYPVLKKGKKARKKE